jgi:tetratricopeptide (TPR) repeat protein
MVAPHPPSSPSDVVDVPELIRAGRVAEARARCEAVIDAGAADARTRILLAACLQRLGQPTEAVSALKAAAEASSDPGLLRHVADALLKLSAFEAAAAIGARLDAARPETVLLQARCRWGLGDYRAALRQLDALSGIVPDWPTLALSHARMRINVDEPDRAKAILDRALQQRPDEPSLLHQKALLLVSTAGAQAALAWIRPRFEDRRAADADATDPLAQLVEALSTITGSGDATLRPGEAWDGFRQLLAESDPATVWFGDNVALLKAALARAPRGGLIVECGVHHGRTVNLLAAWAPDRRVYGFDSFQGLPEAWSEREPAGSYSTGGRVPEVRANVEIVSGWFAETLPAFAESRAQRTDDTSAENVALLHVDCDLYASTADVLSALGPRLAPGAVVVFDEYTGYPGWREHEYRAWAEHCEGSGLDSRLIAAQLLGQSAAFEVSAP